MSSKIGKKLRRAREESGLTQKEVAKKAGIHYNHYNRIENDKAEPSVPVLEKIAKVLNIKSSELFSF